MGLSTNFKDDVISDGGLRKYNMIQNSDGTVSFEDVTEYSQVGSSFGAKEVNEERTAINELESKVTNHQKNVSAVGNVLIATGSVKVAVDIATSAKVFSKKDVDNLFGVTDSGNSNVVFVFANACGEDDPLHLDGATYDKDSGNWYAVFDRQTTGIDLRINYIGIYFGSQTGSSGGADDYQDGDEVSY